MSTETWLAALEKEVIGEAARMRSMVATIDHRREQATASVERVLRTIDARAGTRSRPLPADRHASILDAVRRRDIASLPVSEQRYAARQFKDLRAVDMQALLLSRPTHWRTYTTACFRDWDTFRACADRLAHERLLCAAPAAIAFMHDTIPASHLVVEQAPRTVAAEVRATSLRDARAWLTSRGFDSSWAFTATSLAHWAWGHAQARGTVVELWNELSTEPVAEAMLLPARPDSRRSWFSADERPARAGSSVTAHAIFASALLRTALRLGPAVPAWNTYMDVMLRSRFGDPRVPPETEGWKRVRELDESAYRDFMATLVADDLKVFFQYAMSDAARERFWLRYKRSIRRTTCVLDRATHSRLKQRLAGDKQLGAAIGRAKRFVKETTGAQAFCLYFDRHVIVEFSQTGNAAQIYERAAFEAAMQRQVDDESCEDPSRLKRPELYLDRIIHNDGWEDRAQSKLRTLAIVPDAWVGAGLF